MKRILLVCFLSVVLSHSLFAENPKYEFRATWLTGNGIDWPKSHNITQQKESLCKILDVMAKGKHIAHQFHLPGTFAPIAASGFKTRTFKSHILDSARRG